MAEYLIKDSTLIAIGDAIREKTGKTATLSPNKMVTEILNIPTGVELNFEIVGGTTKPTNPKENTIWVNTSTDITSWVFSAQEPNNPTNGMVWFLVGSSSVVEFNALKNNILQVYPYFTRQYINNAWVVMTPMSYQNSEWISWRNYIFKEGEGPTSDWSFEKYNNGSGSVSTSSIYLSSPYTQESDCAIGKKTAVDMTNYTQLVFDIETSHNWCQCGISDTAISSYNPTLSAYQIPSADSRVTITVDISSVDEGYIIIRHLDGEAGTTNVYNIYMI